MAHHPAHAPDATGFHPPHLWLGAADDRPRTRLFRRAFHLDAPPATATLRLFAEARYHVWINGRYLARGPILHHGHRLPVASYDAAALLQPGGNVIAAAVYSFGCGLHNHIQTGRPGLSAELSWTDAAGDVQTLQTDAQWRVTDRTGWSPDVPRRGWAIGHVEVFDAAEAPPAEWTTTGFDEGADWRAPDVSPSALVTPGSVFFADPLPPLRYHWRPAARVLSFHQVDAPPPPVRPDYKHGDYGRLLMDQPWRDASDAKLAGALDDTGGGLRIEGLTPDHGAVLNLDLGAQHCGQVILDCDCPTAGTIDVGWSEWDDDGRPRILQKGTSYVDRIEAAPGRVRWEQMQFNAGRYLSIWFRGFTGSVTIRGAGMRASEPDLTWAGRFDSSDETLNRIWSLCQRTLRIGTQEGLMDCPTREQACYIGDGHPVARWIGQQTGDFRHWRYLVREQFARQAANGLIRSTPFSWRDDTLIDYTLLAIINTRDYLRFTGDKQTARDVLEGCHRVLGWFDRHADERGLFAWAWPGPPSGPGQAEHVYDPDRPRIETDLNLFIDHAGMGWHNPGEPGIDRRGVNAAINALLVSARQALAEMEAQVGSAQKGEALRVSAESLRRAARETFRDAAGPFVDGELDGKRLEQISEQTNAWAVQAGLAAPQEAGDILRQVVFGGAAGVARGGPYFWTYTYPAAHAAGLTAQALGATRRLWRPMLDRGATTLWETFAGDDHDTACHPWSGAPVEFLLTAIAGLPAAALPGEHVGLYPRYDLLDRVDARLLTAAGPIDIAWDTPATPDTPDTPTDGLRLRGSLPPGLTATVHTPDGHTHGPLTGTWERTCNVTGPPRA